MYKNAIEKLKFIQKDNEDMVSKIERREIVIENADERRIKSLCETYRWWAHCAGMAAWLLQQSTDNQSKTCDCQEPMILEKSYRTQCGRDIYPPAV